MNMLYILIESEVENKFNLLKGGEVDWIVWIGAGGDFGGEL